MRTEMIALRYIALFLLPSAAIGRDVFQEDVRPVLQQHCFACHGPDEQTKGIRLHQYAAAQDQIARLRAMLDTTSERELLPAKVVHFPNPRSAPEGATPLLFVCRVGKVYYWDRDGLQ